MCVRRRCMCVQCGRVRACGYDVDACVYNVDACVSDVDVCVYDVDAYVCEVCKMAHSCVTRLVHARHYSFMYV